MVIRPTYRISNPELNYALFVPVPFGPDSCSFSYGVVVSMCSKYFNCRPTPGKRNVP